MARKTTPTQVLLAMEHAVGVDMQNFKYRMGTGRCLYDGEIMELMGCPGWTAFKSEMRIYYNMKGSLAHESLETLKRKKYITPTAIKRARKIKDLYLRQEKRIGSQKKAKTVTKRSQKIPESPLLRPPAGSGLQLQSSFGGGGGQTHFAGDSPKRKGKTTTKKTTKKREKKGSNSLAPFGVMPRGQKTLEEDGKAEANKEKTSRSRNGESTTCKKGAHPDIVHPHEKRAEQSILQHSNSG